MINVAFTAPQAKDWMGGVNYHKNLFFAISSLDKVEINPVVFLGNNTDPAIVELLKPHAKLVFDSLFDRKSLKFKVANFIAYHMKWPFLQNRIFKKHDIQVAHHVWGPYEGLKCKTISWIPDFQHLHLGHLFTKGDVDQRNTTIRSLLKISDAVILSSHDAYDDCLKFDANAENRLHVLQFVSQPNPEVFKLTKSFIKNKTKIPEKYFYLPNQFWEHKNHLQVFEAIKLLKDSGLQVHLVCSGAIEDYRNPEYIEKVKSCIASNELEGNVTMLGFIDYLDVLYLIRYSVSVINPSLFEGWSSTVEECKSIGKNMILSDLNVHKEQSPAKSRYFELENTLSLVDCLRDAWLSTENIPNIELEIQASQLLPTRTKEFAKRFQSIVMDII